MKTALCVVMGVTALLAVLHGSTQAADAMVPLRTELPKPMLWSGPKPIPADLLTEPQLLGRRPDFMIPAGCTNLALGKKVSASVKQPNQGELSEITDGLKSCEADCCVELESGPQWIQIDLEAASEVFALLIWRQATSPRVYHAVVVQVSDNPKFRKHVQTIFNSDRENMHGLGVGKDLGFIENYQGHLIDAKGIKGRYVRLYSSGNTWNKLNHYSEVEVWGRPAK